MYNRVAILVLSVDVHKLGHQPSIQVRTVHFSMSVMEILVSGEQMQERVSIPGLRHGSDLAIGQSSVAVSYRFDAGQYC